MKTFVSLHYYINLNGFVDLFSLLSFIKVYPPKREKMRYITMILPAYIIECGL